jgi:DNA-binding response OmpR family regulator
MIDTLSDERALVLNVEDHEAARYAKSHVLKSSGYDVLEAATGSEALRLARERKPQLALIDVKMPDVSGIEVCRMIKNDPETASTMVLLISAAYVKAEDKVMGLEEGADGYLVQPIEAEELRATVKALLRIHSAERRLRHSVEELHARADELGRFNRAAVDRELRMRELKSRINELCRELGRPEPYPAARDSAPTGSAGVT